MNKNIFISLFLVLNLLSFSLYSQPFNKTYLTKVVEGERVDLFVSGISFYSSDGNSSSPETPVTTLGNGESFYNNENLFFSKDGSKQMEASYENLMIHLSDNNNSLQHLKAYENFQYIKYGLYTIGAGLLISGLANFKKQYAGALIISGAISINLGLIPSLLQNEEIEQAVKAYNKY